MRMKTKNRFKWLGLKLQVQVTSSLELSVTKYMGLIFGLPYNIDLLLDMENVLKRIIH